MREVFLSDLTAATRAVLTVPMSQRPDMCRQMFIEADWADKFTRRLSKTHQHWGNGTLIAAAMARELTPERSFSDPDYTACFVMVLQCFQHHRAAKACKSKLHAHMKNELHHGFAFG